MKIYYAKYTDDIKIYKRVTEKELKELLANTEYLVMVDKIEGNAIYYSEFYPYDFI